MIRVKKADLLAVAHYLIGHLSTTGTIVLLSEGPLATASSS
jgi:hypothetical protein